MQRTIKKMNHTARGFAYVTLTGAMIIGASYFNYVTAQTAQPAAQGATTAAPARYVTGEVTTLDATAKQLTLKTDAGETVLVVLTGTTAYNRLPGGETSPAKAVPATLADVAVGDRVLVDRGRIAAGQTVAAASKVFVMSRADVAAKQERDQAEWQNGVVGVVTAVNPQAKEIVVQPRGRVAAAQQGTPPVDAASPVTLKIADSTLFRRYAPESVRFADARISSLGELKVGDQLRARGERTADGGLTPKEIVSGSFRTLAGFVSAVNPTTGEVTLTPLGGGAPVIVNVKADSTLRRVPPMMAMAMANRGAAGGGNNPDGARRGATGGRPERQSGTPSSSPSGAPDESNRGGRGGRGGMMGGGNRPGGGFDLQEMMERLPALTIADLKAGDGIVVSSTDTGDATRATAITLIAGVEALLASPAARIPQGRGGAAGGIGGDAGGFGGFDLGIGGP
ncbi:MAG: hypothetical protein MSG64_16440 [Pyrinomonadaceae bacterium MAG19_C2-C3]|nr:hypothetical protein [Pyrinomonadaceae bacterium MAG19_C2-C3]